MSEIRDNLYEICHRALVVATLGESSPSSFHPCALVCDRQPTGTLQCNKRASETHRLRLAGAWRVWRSVLKAHSLGFLEAEVYRYSIDLDVRGTVSCYDRSRIVASRCSR